jgi:hypothetical protein
LSQLKVQITRVKYCPVSFVFKCLPAYFPLAAFRLLHRCIKVKTFEQRKTAGKMTFEQATLGQSGIFPTVEKASKKLHCMF